MCRSFVGDSWFEEHDSEMASVGRLPNIAEPLKETGGLRKQCYSDCKPTETGLNNDDGDERGIRIGSTISV